MAFEPSCAWLDDEVTSQVAKVSFRRISGYRKQSTAWSLTMPVACMWHKPPWNQQTKIPAPEILAERV